MSHVEMNIHVHAKRHSRFLKMSTPLPLNVDIPWAQMTDPSPNLSFTICATCKCLYLLTLRISLLPEQSTEKTTAFLGDRFADNT